MAALAVDVRPVPVRRFLSQLAPSAGRVEFAIRLAIVCALTTLVAEIYQTPEPALTAYLGFFIVKTDKVTSILISCVMTVLVTIVITALMLVARISIDEPLWRFVLMAAVSFCLLFATSASKLRPVGASVALIGVYAISELGSAPVGEAATRALLYAWLFIGIPAGVCIVVNLLIGPSPRRLAERALAHRLTAAAVLLRWPDARSRQTVKSVLGEGVSEIRTWLKLERMAQTSSPADIVALEQAATSITPILLLVALIDCRGDAWPADLRDYLALVVREMAEILRAGGYPVEISLRDEAFSRDLTSDGAAILRELKETLVHFTELSPASVEAPTPPKAKGGFFAPDAFTNSDHVYFALKTTAAAMVCYITYTLLDWPGIHTCLITCYVASLATAAETIEKLTLRIVGCLAGAVAGLATMIWLIPDLTSIEALLTVIFIATVISGYIVAGGPRISYAGFQVGFAFFLCILQGAGPGFDMVTARDRIIGILFGILVMYLVFTVIRPTSVARRITTAIPKVLRRLGEMTTAATGASRGAMSTDVNAALCDVVRDLEIAGYEPSSVRPPKDWLAIRRQALGEMAAVLGPLLLVANQNCAPLEAFASRFDRLADHLEHASGTDAPPDASDQEYAERAFPTGEPEAASDLNAMIDGHLARLESLFADVADPRSSMHAPA